jgi:hypothetical protein
MRDDEREEEEFDNEGGGRFAVPGKESHESPETLSPDERDNPPDPDTLPGPSEPKQPSPD